MRILLLTHAFNSLCQRLWLELEACGHEISLELDINDAATRQAVALWQPEVLVAPFLKRAIPEDIWRALPCLVVHPGPPGDRGPSALDWAIQLGESTWGVTVLQAVAEMDAGPVWAWREFPLRHASKSSVYRREVTEGAVAGVLEALERLADGRGPQLSQNIGAGCTRPPLRQAERAIDWPRHRVDQVLARIRAADGQPGVRDELGGHPVWLHDAAPAPALSASPGEWIGEAGEALARACRDGLVWIGHLSIEIETGKRLKLPASTARACLGLAPLPLLSDQSVPNRARYEVHGRVGVLHFPYGNGALSTARCAELLAAIRGAARSPEPVLLLAGGPEFWCNGLDLATIEAAASPADASMANIEAIDDICQALIEMTEKLVVSALAGNAGAGGVFMALAADEVWVRRGVVLNPHYRNMGNLYGSEYWTYLLPRRIGVEAGERLMATRLPLGAEPAVRMRLCDALIDGDPEAFLATAIARAQELAADAGLAERLAAKASRRAEDEAGKPLAEYRGEELERMRLNFYGFDTSYHLARHDFITKVPPSRTPLHLARHRKRSQP
jgi:putative two-component system hydrogenase maturation factor HypX/HoxX